MADIVTARMRYDEARAKAKEFAACCRAADVPVPVLTSWADRVLRDYDTRVINRTWLELIHREIK